MNKYIDINISEKLTAPSSGHYQKMYESRHEQYLSILIITVFITCTCFVVLHDLRDYYTSSSKVIDFFFNISR
jgi:hypothetical protein